MISLREIIKEAFLPGQSKFTDMESVSEDGRQLLKTRLHQLDESANRLLKESADQAAEFKRDAS